MRRRWGKGGKEEAIEKQEGKERAKESERDREGDLGGENSFYRYYWF